MLNNVRIILVNPSHPGNIGAAARALKNMGLSQLYLVSPRNYPHIEATARASGADDILHGAVVVDSVEKALVNCGLIIGASARNRRTQWPILEPRECAEKVIGEADKTQVAVLFGRERTGLTNEELSLCHYHVNIPANPDYSSLNLSAAVQVISYEIAMTKRYQQPQSEVSAVCESLASGAEMADFYRHLQEVMYKVDFLTGKKPTQLILRLKRLFNRARLSHQELNILRGIFSATEQAIKRKEHDSN